MYIYVMVMYYLNIFFYLNQLLIIHQISLLGTLQTEKISIKALN